MTRILIVSLNYAPEETGIAPYSTALAEHFAARGCDVTAVTGVPHYPSWRADDAHGRRFISQETRNGVDVRRARHYVPASPSPMRRALYEASSLAMALAASRVSTPDAIMGVIPSVSGGVVARALAARFGAPYGLIFQDLVGPAAFQSGTHGGAGVSVAVRAVEGWATRGAAAAGIIAEGMRAYVTSLGVRPERIVRVRNWARGAARGATMKREEARLLLGWPRDAFICLHAGNMGAKQGLENVIACARLAAESDRRLFFVLMGDGNQRDALKAMAERVAPRNLRFMTLQPELLYASVLGAADALLLNQRGSVRDMALPSKLTSYFASGRPVVAAVADASEAAAEVRASGGGIVAAPDDPAALLDAIARVADDAALARTLGQRGVAWARDVLSEDAALRAYEELLERVLAGGRRSGVARRSPAKAATVGEGRPPFEHRRGSGIATAGYGVSPSPETERRAA
jgi:glycosyltransferase involved in cell wall biosynthesis